MPSSTKRKAKPKVTFDYGAEDIGLETLEEVKKYADDIAHFSKQQSEHIITFEKFQKKKKKSEAEVELLQKCNTILKRYGNLATGAKVIFGKEYPFSDEEKEKFHGVILNAMVRKNSRAYVPRLMNSKSILFFTDKIEIVCLKNILSQKAQQGQAYFYKLHDLMPFSMKLECKYGGYPAVNKMRRGLNSRPAREKWGNRRNRVFTVKYSGKACTGNYTSGGKKVKFMIENPVSRQAYGNGNKDGTSTLNCVQRFKKVYKQYQAQHPETLTKTLGEIEEEVDCFFKEMKAISKQYLPHFVEDWTPERESFINESFWDENLKMTTNMNDTKNQSAAHFDTTPVQYGFFTMLTMLCDKDLSREGELAFPGLGMRIQYGSGDVILMRPDLYHGVMSMVTKDLKRYSLVLYNNFTSLN